MADALEGVALVTGSGRGIGASIARELAGAGMRVAVSGRTAPQVEAVAAEIDGLPLTGDVAKHADVVAWVERAERELGPVALLVNNAGISGPAGPTIESSVAEWWHVFEVNVLGAYHCCHEVIPLMLGRGGGRVVNVSSGAAYLPYPVGTSYGPSKAALSRFTELLELEVASGGVHVFHISPGLVRTEMTASFGDDAAWTPPELAPRLVRVLATGRADRLAGRYLHAEHDDIEELIRRADEVVADDLNAIRLRR
jgi:NAD(P)-dependent dehydrogenase (short-subunit alcohol dehydrogenase family)